MHRCLIQLIIIIITIIYTRDATIFSSLNLVRQMSCCRSSTGRLFHSRGLATPKLLSPSLDCVRGTVRVWTSADRRCRRPTSATSWQSSDRYGGARRWSDLYTSTMTLKSIRCLTAGSQCHGRLTRDTIVCWKEHLTH